MNLELEEDPPTTSTVAALKRAFLAALASDDPQQRPYHQDQWRKWRLQKRKSKQRAADLQKCEKKLKKWFLIMYVH